MDYIRTDHLAAEDTVGGIGKSGAIKPKRTGTKQVPQEKTKTDSRKPVGKKPVATRRAPARGKYIDEYASPAFQPRAKNASGIPLGIGV